MENIIIEIINIVGTDEIYYKYNPRSNISMMQSNYLYLVQTIDYIELHIKDKITIDDIANNINLSKYHLHRIITSVIGRPLMDYVRARKLAESLDMLIYTNCRIIDICETYGFSYEQSYIKAFKKEFSITPNAYRKGQIPITVTEKFDLTRLTQMKDGLIAKPFFTSKQQMTLVGIKNYFSHTVNKINNTATVVGTDFFFNHRDEIKNPKNSDIYIGYSIRKKDDPEYNMYMPSLEVSNADVIPKGMDVLIIEPHHYAVFRYIGNIHSRYITWKHLKDIKACISKWLETSTYEMINEFDFEYIDSSIATENYSEVDIYIPVKGTEDI